MYSDLSTKYEIMKTTFEMNLDKFTDLFNTIEYVMRSSPKFIIRKIIRENPQLMISVLKAMRTNDIPIHGKGGMFNKVFLPKGILQDGILLGDIEILGF